MKSEFCYWSPPIVIKNTTPFTETETKKKKTTTYIRYYFSTNISASLTLSLSCHFWFGSVSRYLVVFLVTKHTTVRNWIPVDQTSNYLSHQQCHLVLWIDCFMRLIWCDHRVHLLTLLYTSASNVLLRICATHRSKH